MRDRELGQGKKELKIEAIFTNLLYLTTCWPCLGSREVCVDVHPVVVGGATDPAGAGALALRGPVPAIRVEAGHQRDVSIVHQARDPGVLNTDGVSAGGI